MTKSFNMAALRGQDIDDKQWQSDMADEGIYVPDNLLYTAEAPAYAIKAMREKNIDSAMQRGWTPADAQEMAAKHADAATESLKSLLQVK